MKKLFKTLAVLAISTSLAFAKNPSASFEVGSYYSKKSNTLKVFFQKENKNGLLLVVKDEMGREMSRDIVGKSKDKFSVGIDISSLGVGAYTIEIFDKEAKYTKTLNFTKEVVEELKIVI